MDNYTTPDDVWGWQPDPLRKVILKLRDKFTSNHHAYTNKGRTALLFPGAMMIFDALNVYMEFVETLWCDIDLDRPVVEALLACKIRDQDTDKLIARATGCCLGSCITQDPDELRAQANSIIHQAQLKAFLNAVGNIDSVQDLFVIDDELLFREDVEWQLKKDGSEVIQYDLLCVSCSHPTYGERLCWKCESLMEAMFQGDPNSTRF